MDLPPPPIVSWFVPRNEDAKIAQEAFDKIDQSLADFSAIVDALRHARVSPQLQITLAEATKRSGFPRNPSRLLAPAAQTIQGLSSVGNDIHNRWLAFKLEADIRYRPARLARTNIPGTWLECLRQLTLRCMAIAAGLHSLMRESAWQRVRVALYECYQDTSSLQDDVIRFYLDCGRLSLDAPILPE